MFKKPTANEQGSQEHTASPRSRKPHSDDAPSLTSDLSPGRGLMGFSSQRLRERHAQKIKTYGIRKVLKKATF